MVQFPAAATALGLGTCTRQQLGQLRERTARGMAAALAKPPALEQPAGVCDGTLVNLRGDGDGTCDSEQKGRSFWGRIPDIGDTFNLAR